MAMKLALEILIEPSKLITTLLGSWYTDSGPDGDITTGAANSGSIELYFNGVKIFKLQRTSGCIIWFCFI